MEEWLNKIMPQWLTNATISASTANPIEGAVAVSGGLHKKDDGSYDYSDVSNPANVELRENLADLSALSDGLDVAPLLGLWQFIRHPAQTVKATKAMTDQAKGYLKKYLSLVDGPRTSGTFKGVRSETTRPLSEYMESLGIDSSYFTESDLKQMIQRREKSVSYPLSRPNGRSATIEETRIGSEGVPEINISVYNDGQYHGNVRGSVTDKDLGNLIIRKVNPAHGFSEAGYNAALNYTKQNNLAGVRSGESLLSPEMTYAVWEKYPNKQFIGNTGEHIFNYGANVIGKEGKKLNTILDGPVYRLTEPSYHIPTKHEGVFHPDVIQDNGKLRIPFWKDPDIYKTLVPIPIIGGTIFEQ